MWHLPLLAETLPPLPKSGMGLPVSCRWQARAWDPAQAPSTRSTRALTAALTEEQWFGNVTEKLCKSQERPERARESVISIRGSGAPCHFPFGSEERPRTS